MKRQRSAWEEIKRRAAGGTMRRAGDARWGAFGVALLAVRDPLDRILQQDMHRQLAAGAGAVTALLTEHAIVGATLLLVVVSTAEYLAEHRLTHAEKDTEWTPELASIRRTLKLTAIVQVWVLYGVEAIVNFLGPWAFSTHGYVAVAACLVLILDEMDNLDANRVRYGQRPLFGWRALRQTILSRLGGGGKRRDRD